MANISQKQFEKDFTRLIEDIRKQATPFINDSTEKKLARKKRALADPFFFAATYFPHYIILKDGFEKECWKNPETKIDWVKMGFSEVHADFFALTTLKNKFEMLFAFRESSKDTLLAKIDVLKKIVSKEIWYSPHLAFSEDHAVGKIIPLKLELEHNERIISDFGNLVGTIKWEENEFITNNGVKVKAFGRDMVMRGQENFGHRPDWIILNDIFDPTKQSNPSVIQKYVESIRQDVLKSANAPRWGAILLANYVSKQSIEHELMTGENTSHFGKNIFRALVSNPKRTKEEQEIARECKSHHFTDQFKSAWEFRHPTLRLLQEQKDDPETFDAEMMMRPKDKKNAKFRDNDFKYYSRQELNGRELVHYTFIDPSAKIASDYKALITIAVPKIGDVFEMFIVNAWIRQASIDEMLEETYRDFVDHKTKIIGVEMIGFASLLEREYLRLMKQKGIPLPIYKVEKVDNKDARIESLVPNIRSGVLKFDPSQGDQTLLIRQFKGFPDKTQVSRGGIGDDGPDATALCVRLINEFPAGSQAVEYKSGAKREARFKKGAY